MTCASAWMESALLDPEGGQRLVIYDEGWRLMSQPSLLRRMDSHWRLARHYGISNVLVFHKLSDLENVGDQGSAMRFLANSLLANAGGPGRLPAGIRPARRRGNSPRTYWHRTLAPAGTGDWTGPLAHQRSCLFGSTPDDARGNGDVRYPEQASLIRWRDRSI